MVFEPKRFAQPSADPGGKLAVGATVARPGPSALYWFPSSTTWSPDGTTLLIVDADVVAVRLDGQAPPVVLYDGGDVSGYDGYPSLPFQSWGRVP